MTILGYVSSSFGQISHDTIIVAPSFGFLNMLKSCFLFVLQEQIKFAIIFTIV